jgi:hypothetical protein
MMNTLTTVGGGAIMAGIALIVSSPLTERTPEKFMDVQSIYYLDGNVHSTRIVNVPKMIADWRVTVVGDTPNAPFCQTTQGRSINKGWSIYVQEGAEEKVYSLDDWVWDDSGCSDRLTPGFYTMFMEWEPRDGTDTVIATLRFEI